MAQVPTSDIDRDADGADNAVTLAVDASHVVN